MKKIIALVMLILTVSVFLTACASKQESTTVQTTQPKVTETTNTVENPVVVETVEEPISVDISESDVGDSSSLTDMNAEGSSELDADVY